VIGKFALEYLNKNSLQAGYINYSAPLLSGFDLTDDFIRFRRRSGL